MKIQMYLALSKDQLRDELARMGLAQRARFDAELAMFCALREHAIVPTVLPAFMIEGGKIVQPNKQVMTGRSSVCRAPHKNQR